MEATATDRDVTRDHLGGPAGRAPQAVTDDVAYLRTAIANVFFYGAAAASMMRCAVPGTPASTSTHSRSPAPGAP